MKKIFMVYAMLIITIWYSMPIFAVEGETAPVSKEEKSFNEKISTKETKLADKEKALKNSKISETAKKQLNVDIDQLKLDLNGMRMVQLENGWGDYKNLPKDPKGNVIANSTEYEENDQQLSIERDLIEKELKQDKEDLGTLLQLVRPIRESVTSVKEVLKSVSQTITDALKALKDFFTSTEKITTNVISELPESGTTNIKIDNATMATNDLQHAKDYLKKYGFAEINMRPSHEEIENKLMQEKNIQDTTKLSLAEKSEASAMIIKMEYAQERLNFFNSVAYPSVEDAVDNPITSGLYSEIGKLSTKSEQLNQNFNELVNRYKSDLGHFNRLAEAYNNIDVAQLHGTSLESSLPNFIKQLNARLKQLNGVDDSLSKLKEKMNSIPDTAEFNRNIDLKNADEVSKLFIESYKVDEIVDLAIDAYKWSFEKFESTMDVVEGALQKIQNATQQYGKLPSIPAMEEEPIYVNLSQFQENPEITQPPAQGIPSEYAGLPIFEAPLQSTEFRGAPQGGQKAAPTLYKVGGQPATSSGDSVAPTPQVELTTVPPPYETLQQGPPG